MNGLHRNRVRALRQAEGGPTAGIEPVGDVADAVLLLDLHVAGVGDGEVHGRDAGDIVAIEKEWHNYLQRIVSGRPPVRSG